MAREWEQSPAHVSNWSFNAYVKNIHFERDLKEIVFRYNVKVVTVKYLNWCMRENKSAHKKHNRHHELVISALQR